MRTSQNLQSLRKRSGLKELSEDCDTSIYQGAYRINRAKYAKQLAKDSAMDEEEENDDGVSEKEQSEDEA